MFMYRWDYLKAIRNEVAIDESFYQRCGVSPSSFGYMPRPLVWLSKYKKYKNSVLFFSLLTKTFLFLGGWFFLFSIELIKSWSTFNKIDGEKLNFDCIVIAFSERTYDVIKKNKSLITEDYVWICFPWNQKPNECNYIDCYNLISKWEAVRILFGSLFLAYYFNFIKNGTWVLQFYTMYRWMLVRHALSKLSAENYVCTEHFDRWAILLDCALQEKNERGMSFRFMLFQHGILKQLSEDGKNYIHHFEFDLPSKLYMVTDVYAYDLESISIFKHEIINDSVVSKVRFNSVSMGFSLAKEIFRHQHEMEMRRSILIVGHPLCFGQQLNIYNRISGLAVVYYKPHPTTIPSDIMLNVGWEVIEDKACFPKVDFLISYPSTLVVEYKTLGIDSVVHPLNASIVDIETCIVSTLKRLGYYAPKE